LWILEHATAYQGEAKLMRCEYEATLAKPGKDILMGSKHYHHKQKIETKESMIT
jgi:hypothetical protein